MDEGEEAFVCVSAGFFLQARPPRRNAPRIRME